MGIGIQNDDNFVNLALKTDRCKRFPGFSLVMVGFLRDAWLHVRIGAREFMKDPEAKVVQPVPLRTEDVLITFAGVRAGFPG